MVTFDEGRIMEGKLIQPWNRHYREFWPIVVCPMVCTQDPWWECVVVKAAEGYPVGWILAVHQDDLEKGIKYKVGEPE